MKKIYTSRRIWKCCYLLPVEEHTRAVFPVKQSVKRLPVVQKFLHSLGIFQLYQVMRVFLTAKRKTLFTSQLNLNPTKSDTHFNTRDSRSHELRICLSIEQCTNFYAAIHILSLLKVIRQFPMPPFVVFV